MASVSAPVVQCPDVIVRLRPTTATATCASILGPGQIRFRASNDNAESLFSFDGVHGNKATQADVFDGVRHVVECVMHGFNGTIMAYGQTGSGKTHTLIGSLDDPSAHGIVPRAVDHLAHKIFESDADRVTVRLSVVEIYCERVRDLLGGTQADNLQVKQDAQRGMYIDGAIELEVETEGQLVDVMALGLSQRAASATAMNEVSSRSHCIVTVTVERVLPHGALQRGKLVMVDLAGSERQDRSATSGQALVEGAQINKSLSCLANVIAALTDERGRQHVPYRDSKLTRVLQDSLGGTARTVLIICCSPAVENGPETLSSLRFGARAKGIKNTVQANTRTTGGNTAVLQQQLAALQKENDRLRTELAAATTAAAAAQEPQRDAAFDPVAPATNTSDSADTLISPVLPGTCAPASATDPASSVKSEARTPGGPTEPAHGAPLDIAADRASQEQSTASAQLQAQEQQQQQGEAAAVSLAVCSAQHQCDRVLVVMLVDMVVLLVSVLSVLMYWRWEDSAFA